MDTGAGTIVTGAPASAKAGRRLLCPLVERLGAGDLATLWAEEPGTPMHIGLAGLLDAGPLVDQAGRLRLAELRAAVDARLARAPQLRRRIRWTGFGQGRPAVVDDQEFAIRSAGDGGWPSSAAPSTRSGGPAGPMGPPSTTCSWPPWPVGCAAC